MFMTNVNDITEVDMSNVKKSNLHKVIVIVNSMR
jgi:hypothetical protein